MNAADRRQGPLRGVRIVEFAGIGPGPFAAMLLADMGADIIRVDRPGGADPWTKKIVRRGRPTVTADLKDPAQIAIVSRLVSRADALIEGFRPGVMERLGLGPEAMLALNPRLVYGRMTGWGQTGPLANSAGHDITYIAVAGALAAIGPRERPAVPLNLVGDFGGGALYLVAGLLAGIISARSTGRGQVVDAAMCDGAASLMAMFLDLAEQGRWQESREANLLDGGAPFYSTYECADGRYMAVGSLEPQFYRDLCERIGIPPGPEAARLDPANWPELRERLAAVFKTRDRDAWTALLEGTEACAAPVLTLSEARSHPHLAARGVYTEAGGAVHPAPAPRFSGTPTTLNTSYAEQISLDEALGRWAEGTIGNTDKN